MLRKLLFTTLAASALLGARALATEPAPARDATENLPACCQQHRAMRDAMRARSATQDAAPRRDAQPASHPDENAFGQRPYWAAP